MKETPVQSSVASVGLFKNGLTVVKSIVTVPGPGSYFLEDLPEPVHGTFCLESSASIEAQMTTRLVPVSSLKIGSSDFQEALAGKEVTIHFRDGKIAPANGIIESLDTGEKWSRGYERPRYYWWGYQQSETQQTRPAFLILKTSSGRIVVDPSMIAYMDIKDNGDKWMLRKPVLVFTVKEAKEKPVTIVVRYLTKGMAWAPDYYINLTDPKTLSISQKAVIKNELFNLADTEISLISGFPSIKFSHVISPLSLQTTWTEFFKQLNQRFEAGDDSTQNVISQQVMYNRREPSRGIDLSAIPVGEGVDIHYQSIGKHTMTEGDSLATTIASATAPYERVVEWMVPDNRDEYGRLIQEYQRRSNPEKYDDSVWDAIRFKNPFGFPMTTAPAMIVSGDKFNGQTMSYWVNSGEQTTIRVTKALSIRTYHSQREDSSSRRDLVYIGTHAFAKVRVSGEFRVNNHRKENVSMIIRCRFSGDLLKADLSPQCVLCEEGVYTFNKRNELTWELALKPGEEVILNYQYAVLVLQ